MLSVISTGLGGFLPSSPLFGSGNEKETSSSQSSVPIQDLMASTTGATTFSSGVVEVGFRRAASMV